MSRKSAPAALPLAGLLLAGFVSACAPTMGPPPPPPPSSGGSSAAFNTEDFSWSAVPGPNSLVGRLAARPAAYTCHGATVILTPETPWSRRRMVALYGSADRAALPADEVRARTPSAPAGDYSAFIRRAVCEGDRFSFAGLPDGAWFAITIAKPTAASGGDSLALMRRVVTRGGRIAVTEL